MANANNLRFDLDSDAGLSAATGRLNYSISSISMPSRIDTGFLRNHPVRDPLRDHPRFQALLEEYEVE